MVVDSRDPSQFTDEEIVVEILKSSKNNLFEIIYDRYVDKIFRKCISFTNDQDEAKDLAHDVFIKIYTNLSKFKGQSKFSTWVYAVTYNKCVDYQKEIKKIRTFKDDYLDTEVFEMEDLPDENLFTIRADMLREALEMLDPNDKALLLMKYQDNYPVKTIMELLEISESAVKMRLKRSKHRLMKLIDQRVRVKMA